MVPGSLCVVCDSREYTDAVGSGLCRHHSACLGSGGHLTAATDMKNDTGSWCRLCSFSSSRCGSRWTGGRHAHPASARSAAARTWRPGTPASRAVSMPPTTRGRPAPCRNRGPAARTPPTPGSGGQTTAGATCRCCFLSSGPRVHCLGISGSCCDNTRQTQGLMSI